MNIKSYLALRTVVVVLLCVFSRGMAMGQEAIVTYPNNKEQKNRPYSEVVSIDLGNAKMLIISGQVALNENGELVGKDDLELQTIQVFANLKRLILMNGGNMNHIVKTGIFMTDLSKVDLFRKVRATYMDPVNPPASTLVGVTGLYRKDLLIEIEATVVIPK